MRRYWVTSVRDGVVMDHIVPRKSPAEAAEAVLTRRGASQTRVLKIRDRTREG